MRSILENRSLILSARIVVGAIFLFSSIEKAYDPLAFASLVDNYKLIPFSWSLAVATFLPWIELVCGVALIFGTSFRGASLIIGSMTIVFTAAVVSGIMRDLDISCGCFTLDPEVSRIGWQKVLENTGIIILCAYLLLARGDAPAIVPTGTAGDHSS